MFYRFRLSIALAILLGLLFTVPVFAGGWAVMTLDQLPDRIVANQPVHIGFMVRQHGRTPMSGLTPVITARLSDSKDSIVVDAKPEGEVGHYAATLTFPKNGIWKWNIQAFTMDQPMPALNVIASANDSASAPVAKTESISPLIVVRALALAIGLIGLAIAFRRRSRPAMTLTALCLLVGITLFVAGSGSRSKVEAQSEASVKAAGESSISQVEIGKNLFIAKGCVTCHVNNKVPYDMRGTFTVDIGPNLSNFSADPGYLEKWLFKPSAIKPQTQMPDLNLSEQEIDALTAFINSK